MTNISDHLTALFPYQQPYDKKRWHYKLQKLSPPHLPAVYAFRQLAAILSLFICMYGKVLFSY